MRMNLLNYRWLRPEKQMTTTLHMTKTWKTDDYDPTHDYNPKKIFLLDSSNTVHAEAREQVI